MRMTTLSAIVAAAAICTVAGGLATAAGLGVQKEVIADGRSAPAPYTHVQFFPGGGPPPGWHPGMCPPHCPGGPPPGWHPGMGPHANPMEHEAIAACARRFRSYDIRTRSYLGYDGHRHPCP